MRHPPLVALCVIMMLSLLATFGYTSGDRDACVIDDGAVVDRTSGTNNQLDVAYVVAVTNGVGFARGATSMERMDRVSMKYTLILASTSDDRPASSTSDANAMLKDRVDAIGWSTGAAVMNGGGGTLHNRTTA